MGSRKFTSSKLGASFFINYQPAKDLILPHLDIKDIGHLSIACKDMCNFFKIPATVARLAHFVAVNPSEIEVKKILDDVTPDLLKTLLRAKVPSVFTKSRCTIINSTVWQLAFGAGDYEMCSVLASYFELSFGCEISTHEIFKQFNEKFAEDNNEIMKRENNDLVIRKYYVAMLKLVIRDIANEPFNLGHDNEGRLILNPVYKVPQKNFAHW